MNNITFVSPVHHEKYQALLARSQAYDDREFQAAIYVLTAIPKDIKDYIEPRKIYFSRLMKECKLWSSSEKALVRLAATLYNDSAWPVRVGDVFFHLDQTNTRVALEGLRIRYQF